MTFDWKSKKEYSTNVNFYEHTRSPMRRTSRSKLVVSAKRRFKTYVRRRCVFANTSNLFSASGRCHRACMHIHSTVCTRYFLSFFVPDVVHWIHATICFVLTIPFFLFRNLVASWLPATARKTSKKPSLRSPKPSQNERIRSPLVGTDRSMLSWTWSMLARRVPRQYLRG